MPPMPQKPLSDGIPKPKRLRDVPMYVLRRVRGFCSRLFYIVHLVWETAPLLLILMALLCLAEGVLPVWGAYISRDLLMPSPDPLQSPRGRSARR